ncbi:hypothetical protein, partial [Enterococcus casseliflavus]|uniref:hypothetical protein n=1 Tax=Enterococcus casseliflavus TaxID=37734 RepID=UPI003D102507
MAIQIINRSTSASFKESIEATAGKAQLIIVGGETGFSDSVLKDVIKTPGIAHAVPMIQTRV